MCGLLSKSRYRVDRAHLSAALSLSLLQFLYSLWQMPRLGVSSLPPIHLGDLVFSLCTLVDL